MRRDSPSSSAPCPPSGNAPGRRGPGRLPLRPLREHRAASSRVSPAWRAAASPWRSGIEVGAKGRHEGDEPAIFPRNHPGGGGDPERRHGRVSARSTPSSTARRAVRRPARGLAVRPCAPRPDGGHADFFAAPSHFSRRRDAIVRRDERGCRGRDVESLRRGRIFDSCCRGDFCFCHFRASRARGFHVSLAQTSSVKNPKDRGGVLAFFAWSVRPSSPSASSWSVLTTPGFTALAIGFGELEHRYCLRGLPRTDAFPLGAVRTATPRVERVTQRTGPPRISTYVDIVIDGTWVRVIPTNSEAESAALSRRLEEEAAAWR